MATSPACRMISAGALPQARVDRTRHSPLRPHHKPKGRRDTHVAAPARLRRRSLEPPGETLVSPGRCPEPAQRTSPLSSDIPALASPCASPRDDATSSHSPLEVDTEGDDRRSPENSSVAGDGAGVRQPMANSVTSPSAGGKQHQRPIGTPGGGPPRAAWTERTQLQGTRPGSSQPESRSTFGSLLHQDSLARLLPHAFARDTSSGGFDSSEARNIWSLPGIDLFRGRSEAGGARADGGDVRKGLVRFSEPRLGWVQQALQEMKTQSLAWNPLAKKLSSQPQKDSFLRLKSALIASAEAAASAEHQTTVDVDQEARGQSQFFLKLSCMQSTVLLNMLAFGYAATGVLVKAMERSPATVTLGAVEATSASAGALSAAGAISAAASGCLSVTTSMDFALRFTAAAVVSGVALWATQPKSSQGGPAPRAQAPVQHQAREGGDSTGLWPAGLDLGLWMFVTYASQAVGLQSTSAHDAALILTASVVLVPLLEALEGSKLHWSVWLATVLACSGLVLLEGGTAEASTQVADVAYAAGLAAPALGPGIPSGHFWCMLAAIGSAVHVVRSEKYCASHTPLQLVTLQLGTTAALGAVWLGASLAHASTLALPTSSGCFMEACAALPLGMVLLAGPLGTGLCEWLELEALQYVKASTATLILTSSPLWASLLAFFTLGETMGVSTMIGGALILSASLQVQLLHPCKEEVGKPF